VTDNCAPAPVTAARLPGLLPVLAAQVRYQLLLLMRTPRAVIAGLILPGGLLALRLGQVRHVAGQGQAASSLAAAVAGLVVFGILSTAYVTHTSGLVSAREDGVLRRWRAAPVPAGGYFIGRITATVLLADTAGLLLVLAGVGLAGLHVTAAMIAGLLLAATLGALTLASVGTAVTSWIPTSQAANPVLMITYLPLIIFSGGLGSVSGLPGPLSELMTYLPAQPLISALTQILQHGGSGLVLVPGRDLAVLAAWAALGLITSVRFFRWDPHRPARRHRQPASVR
jgi:ABC-2 type transport system permease protein